MMSSGAVRISHEVNTLSTEITNLTRRGCTDRQIGRILGKHYKTILYNRRKYGIASGRSHRAALSQTCRKQTMNTRSYKMCGCIQTPIESQSPTTKLRHGLNAYAPITCAGDRCPYRETCGITDYEPLTGRPCIIESMIIDNMLIDYRRQFQYADNDYIGLRVQHLVDVEIKLMRCNRLIAVNPELTYTIWNGERPVSALNPIARYELLLMGERGRVIKDLRTLTFVATLSS